MDMSDSDTSTSRMNMMTPYLHFTGGDNLFFKSWRPSSNGAIAGASIALVVLAISERLLFSIRGVLEARWRRSAFFLNAGRTLERDILSSRKSVAKEGDDVARGALYSLQALLSFALMLAVMTFQGAYIISVVIGLGLGEMLFGRIASAL
ncbi:Ctr copper transporter [Lactarius akahatsu]|uniref:Copper transport protein n=1 Tax=Lactarius akahatsu TaxID=416441 RepID=A0AAD4LLS0_9AGAM|nr:Ctr copper transporter [Lactarius akahatsu]